MIAPVGLTVKDDTWTFGPGVAPLSAEAHKGVVGFSYVPWKLIFIAICAFDSVPGDEGIHAGGLANVQSVEKGFGCAGLASFSGDLFEPVNAPGAEQELGALRAESTGGGRADTAGGAGD